MEPGEATGFGIRLHETAITYSGDKLSSLGRTTDVSPIDGALALQILVDRTSIETFANDGEVTMSACFLPRNMNTELALYASGGEAKIRSLKVTKLNSSWSCHKSAAK